MNYSPFFISELYKKTKKNDKFISAIIYYKHAGYLYLDKNNMICLKGKDTKNLYRHEKYFLSNLKALLEYVNPINPILSQENEIIYNKFNKYIKSDMIDKDLIRV